MVIFYSFDNIFFVHINCIDDKASVTFLRKNLHDNITASGSMPRGSGEIRSDIENLISQLTLLLNNRVTSLTFFGWYGIVWDWARFLLFSLNVLRRLMFWAMRIPIQLRNHYFGYRSGSITVTNTVLGINYVMKEWALCLMIRQSW